MFIATSRVFQWHLSRLNSWRLIWMFSVFHKLFTRTLLLSYFWLNYAWMFYTILLVLALSYILFGYHLLLFKLSGGGGGRPCRLRWRGRTLTLLFLLILYFFSNEYISIFVFHKSLITVLVWLVTRMSWSTFPVVSSYECAGLHRAPAPVSRSGA